MDLITYEDLGRGVSTYGQTSVCLLDTHVLESAVSWRESSDLVLSLLVFGDRRLGEIEDLLGGVRPLGCSLGWSEGGHGRIVGRCYGGEQACEGGLRSMQEGRRSPARGGCDHMAQGLSW